MNDLELELAGRLWRYHNVDEEIPATVDLVLAMGSHDDRVARHAAALMLDGIAPLIVTSGGFGKVTKETRTEPEGRRFRRLVVECGVPPDRVLVESTATNTGENLTLTRDLLDARGIPRPRRAVIVTKPYMKRRALATARRQWPGVSWCASAPKTSLTEYPNDEVPERRMIELIRAARLPTPETNVRIDGHEVDLVWRGAKLVAEIDGYAFHSSRNSFERDRSRDALLAGGGWRVVRFTWRQIVDEPEAVIARLAAALAA